MEQGYFGKAKNGNSSLWFYLKDCMEKIVVWFNYIILLSSVT